MCSPVACPPFPLNSNRFPGNGNTHPVSLWSETRVAEGVGRECDVLGNCFVVLLCFVLNFVPVSSSEAAV